MVYSTNQLLTFLTFLAFDGMVLFVSRDRFAKGKGLQKYPGKAMVMHMVGGLLALFLGTLSVASYHAGFHYVGCVLSIGQGLSTLMGLGLSGMVIARYTKGYPGFNLAGYFFYSILCMHCGMDAMVNPCSETSWKCYVMGQAYTTCRLFVVAFEDHLKWRGDSSYAAATVIAAGIPACIAHGARGVSMYNSMVVLAMVLDIAGAGRLHALRGARQSRMAPLDVLLPALLLLVSAIGFYPDYIHYLGSGEWCFTNLASFSQWPVSQKHINEISLHATGMIFWMAILAYQLWTMGRGSHKAMGYLGGVILMVSLVASWRAIGGTNLPSGHSWYGLSMNELTMKLTAFYITEEMIIGIYKARAGDIAAHRKHLCVSAMFSVAPGLHRFLVHAVHFLSFLAKDASPEDCLWMLEFLQVVLVLVALSFVLTPWIGGHVTVIMSMLSGKSGCLRTYESCEKLAACIAAPSALALAVRYSTWGIQLLTGE